jgi:hypothetical protein
MLECVCNYGLPYSKVEELKGTVKLPGTFNDKKWKYNTSSRQKLKIKREPSTGGSHL